MKRRHFEGIIPPIITPFDAQGEVAESTLRGLVDFWAPHVQGFYACGTYGSGPMMTEEQRQCAAEIVIKQANKRVPVIIHVGAAGTDSAVALARHAESAGAEAVAAVPPYYYAHSDDAILRHFEALVQAVSIPVYAYDNPKCARNTFLPPLLSRLAKSGVHGLKDSSFDILRIYAHMRALQGTNFDFIIGTEALFLPAFIMGVRGCVSGLAICLPELMGELYQACVAMDMEKARELQMKVLVARDIMHFGQPIEVVHAILGLRGIDSGLPKRPFQLLDKAVTQRVRDALHELGALPKA
jgi:4-hydroxy-tetrahydrodipicolinate synthase